MSEEELLLQIRKLNSSKINVMQINESILILNNTITSIQENNTSELIDHLIENLRQELIKLQNIRDSINNINLKINNKIELLNYDLQKLKEEAKAD